MQTLNVLCFGDIVGRPGRNVISEFCKTLRNQYEAQLVIANGENSAGGIGIDSGTAEEIRRAGVDIITLGDHANQRKGVGSFLDTNSSWCIRPGNFLEGAPGKGYTIIESIAGCKVGICNLMGRVFSNTLLDCPFKYMERLIETELVNCNALIVDFHAEATSEKMAFARYFDGRISVVFGTQTHVQTADEQILPGGTSFISDVGMTGSGNGVIGMKKEAALSRFLTGKHQPYEIAEGGERLHGIFVRINPSNGQTLEIRRLQEGSAYRRVFQDNVPL